MLAGATWLAGDVSGALVFAHRGPLVHALLTFPTGRTRSKPTMVVIALAYVDGLVPAVAREPWTTIALMVAVVRCGRMAVGAATGPSGGSPSSRSCVRPRWPRRSCSRRSAA